MPKKHPLYTISLTSNFLLTLCIPLLYAIVLMTIMLTPDNFPLSLFPIALALSAPEKRLAGLVLAVLGILLWIWSWWHLRPSFGVLPQNHKVIITSGPYRFTNHPMYIAIFLTFTGLAITNISFPGFIINLFLLTPVNIIRGFRETKALSK